MDTGEVRAVSHLYVTTAEGTPIEGLEESLRRVQVPHVAHQTWLHQANQSLIYGGPWFEDIKVVSGLIIL